MGLTHTVPLVLPPPSPFSFPPLFLTSLFLTPLSFSLSAFLPISDAMDVYVDRNDRVWLIDLNAYGPEAGTSPLLFLQGWDHPPLLLTAEEQDETTGNAHAKHKSHHTERGRDKEGLQQRKHVLNFHMCCWWSNVTQVCRGLARGEQIASRVRRKMN